MSGRPYEAPSIAASAVVDDSVRVAATAVIAAHAAVIGDVAISAGTTIGVGAVIDGVSGPVRLRDGVVLGPNCTVVGPLVVDSGALVRSGSVVTENVPAHAVVEGNPAVIVGYTNTVSEATALPQRRRVEVHAGAIARLVEFHEARDLRGDLAVGTFPDEVPFIPARFFLVYGVSGRHVRGAHAHRVCEQLLIAVHGSLSVVVDDGTSREEVVLDRPTLGLYLPPMTWGIQYKHSDDAVLLVFASHPYDPADYIRDHTEFIDAVRERVV